jgi:murein L,D-transpeptidase YcbB/YkuD
MAREVPRHATSAAIQSELEHRSASAGRVTQPAEQRDLQRLYEDNDFKSLWIDAAGTPNFDAHDAVALLRSSEDDGLDPEDYELTELEHEVAALLEKRGPNPVSAEQLGAFDVQVSLSVLRYFRHLHLGRVDPRALGFRMVVPAEGHDFVSVLETARSDGRLLVAATELAPQLAQYRGLRLMLAHYRSLSNEEFPALPSISASVKPGDPYAGLRALYQQLIAFGDLPNGTPEPHDDGVYEGTLVDGVSQFQLRHGLRADGVLGKETEKALRVPLSWRVRQIELALERLRWLPDLGDNRLLAVHIPMYSLWGWNVPGPDGIPSLETKVIVGRAVDSRTPVFASDLRHVIFRPYWDVPASIVREEILPIVAQKPDYLREHDMEIVRGAGDGATPVEATNENVALLRDGRLRLRQRPGPRNALGLVKFVFPNVENVYLHATPAQELFSRTRRDFSHGCVRVEDPIGLAEWVLREQPEWTRERIVAAMQGTQTRRVTLARPIRVILFYTTAAFMPQDGTIRFAEDIYGHDPRLDRALESDN